MKPNRDNLVPSPGELPREMAVQAGQIFGLREVMSLPPAAREYFAQLLRNLADAVESGNGPAPEQREKQAGEASLPCTNCQDRHECKEACDRLEESLPGVTQGRGSKENSTGLHVETLRDYEHTRRSQVFREYESCKELFTSKQWEVIYLYYSQGLTQKEIATETRKRRSAVSGLIKRARGIKDKHFEQQRQTFVNLYKDEMRNSA